MSEEYRPSSFISKFHSILKNKNFEAIISYDQKEAKIFIFDKEKLEVQVLPNFFRHNKFTSLIRQLNHYGFKKLKNHPYLTFTHPTLLKGDNFLEIIAKKKSLDVAQKSEEVIIGPIGQSSAYQMPDYNLVRHQQAIIERNDRGPFLGLSSQGSNLNAQMASSVSLLPDFNVFLTDSQNSYQMNYVLPWPGFYQSSAYYGSFQS